MEIQTMPGRLSNEEMAKAIAQLTYGQPKNTSIISEEINFGFDTPKGYALAPVPNRGHVEINFKEIYFGAVSPDKDVIVGFGDYRRKVVGFDFTSKTWKYAPLH
jgi:hypothetical protein